MGQALAPLHKTAQGDDMPLALAPNTSRDFNFTISH